LGLCLRPGKETALPTVKNPSFLLPEQRKAVQVKNFKNVLIIFFEGVGLLYKEFVVQGTIMNK
jgi:hypothetical protein